MQVHAAATTPVKSAAVVPLKPTPAVVIFGRDRKGKPHAAAFSAAEAERAKKAAGLMCYAVWTVPDTGRALARKIAQGVVFGSGRARASLVSRKLMAELELIAGQAPKASKLATPASEPGGGGASEGAGGPNGAGGGTPAGSPEAPPVETLTRPADWAAIGVGSLVLATTGAPGTDDWYEVFVTAQRDADLFELKWFYEPGLPPIVRRRDNLALLPPQPVA